MNDTQKLKAVMKWITEEINYCLYDKAGDNGYIQALKKVQARIDYPETYLPDYMLDDSNKK